MTEAGDLPFDALRKRLEAIVVEIERGDLALERSLELFEEGVGLVRSAHRRLEAAERRVEELLAVDPKGNVVTKPFDSSGAGPTPGRAPEGGGA